MAPLQPSASNRQEQEVISLRSQTAEHQADRVQHMTANFYKTHEQTVHAFITADRREEQT